MKLGTNIVAGIMVLMGIIWSLQGAGILPGSVMSGESFWLYVGLIMVIVGIAILFYQNRQKPGDGEN